jgi:hypothetical protein
MKVESRPPIKDLFIELSNLYHHMSNGECIEWAVLNCFPFLFEQCFEKCGNVSMAKKVFEMQPKDQQSHFRHEEVASFLLNKLHPKCDVGSFFSKPEDSEEHSTMEIIPQMDQLFL